MPAFLHEGEGLAGVDRLQLRGVADEDHTGDAKVPGDGEQPLHRHRADHRGLVHRQQRSAEILAGLRQACGVRKIAIAHQEPLEGPGRDPGLLLQHPRRGGRGGKAGEGALTHEARHLFQHRRLAGAGPALHADHRIARL